MKFSFAREITSVEERSFGKLIFSFLTLPFYRWYINLTNKGSSEISLEVKFYNKKCEPVKTISQSLLPDASLTLNSSEVNYSGVDLIVILFSSGTFERVLVECGGE